MSVIATRNDNKDSQAPNLLDLPLQPHQVSWRSMVFFAIIVATLLFLGGRMLRIQAFEHEDHAAETAKLRSTKYSWTARRGDIVDTLGRPLAIAVPTKSIAIDPKIAIESKIGLDAVLEQIFTTLELDSSQQDKIRTSVARPDSRFVWIKRRPEPDQVHALELAKLPGLIFPEDQLRKYPAGSSAAHVIGWSDIDGIGREGLESRCDPLLRGEELQTDVTRDARRRLLVTSNPIDIELERQGLTAVLTIDLTIQSFCEEVLAKIGAEYNPADGACVLVMSVATGDILALANWPNFDPNCPADSPTENRLNAALATSFEPGSTFKTLVFAAALNDNLIQLDNIFDCENGLWRMPGGRLLRDDHRYGELTANRVLVKSSNIGIAKIAAIGGAKWLYDAVRLYGFGEVTGITLPAEIAGTLHPFKNWTSYSMGSIPMGHEIAVTPLQLVTAYAAVGNGGVLMRPRLIKELRNANGDVVSVVPPQERRRIMTAATAETMRELLAEVVREGTGRKAFSSEYTIGGKTGTAQLPMNAEEIAANGGRRGFSRKRHIANFAAVAPIEDPQIAVLLAVREAQISGVAYGGTIAAPPAKEIIVNTLKYLNVPTNQQLDNKSLVAEAR